METTLTLGDSLSSAVGLKRFPFMLFHKNVQVGSVIPDRTDTRHKNKLTLVQYRPFLRNRLHLVAATARQRFASWGLSLLTQHNLDGKKEKEATAYTGHVQDCSSGTGG